MKFKLLIFTLLVFTSINALSQSTDLPTNPEAGKCYWKKFDYDKKYEWEEVDCNQRKEHLEKLKSENIDPIKKEQTRLKLLAYQKKLIGLGYACEATGKLHDKFIKAHHKHLKQKEKAARKARRKKKKK